VLWPLSNFGRSIFTNGLSFSIWRELYGGFQSDLQRGTRRAVEVYFHIGCSHNPTPMPTEHCIGVNWKLSQLHLQFFNPTTILAQKLLTVHGCYQNLMVEIIMGPNWPQSQIKNKLTSSQVNRSVLNANKNHHITCRDLSAYPNHWFPVQTWVPLSVTKKDQNKN